MGLIYTGVPPFLALAPRDHFGARAFMETGTYKADTTAWAAQHFPRVRTVESNPVRHGDAVCRFAGNPGVVCECAESPAVLRRWATEEDGGVYWLDAHFCGEAQYGSPCPLLDEIRILNEVGGTQFVLVDDARLFMLPVFDDWPDLAQVTILLSNNGRRFVCIVDDVIAAYPVVGKRLLMNYAMRRPTFLVHR